MGRRELGSDGEGWERVVKERVGENGRDGEWKGRVGERWGGTGNGRGGLGDDRQADMQIKA